LYVKISSFSTGGGFLKADMGINFPQTSINLPSITADDIENVKILGQHVNAFSLSFIQNNTDIIQFQSLLKELNLENLGIILKIETATAFKNLPYLLLTSMRSPNLGVMIARGDLAIECGFQRLAELQEEILWICEAAHIPVIWATQVLESYTKLGLPSRAEITDAAMAERAECVMLNKGPRIIESIIILSDILSRMEAHQRKKMSLLRPLHVADNFTQNLLTLNGSTLI